MRLKLCGNVIEIHGKAMRVLQGRSEPPRHSKQPSQPSTYPLTYPRARYVKVCTASVLAPQGVLNLPKPTALLLGSLRSALLSAAGAVVLQ